MTTRARKWNLKALLSVHAETLALVLAQGERLQLMGVLGQGPESCRARLCHHLPSSNARHDVAINSTNSNKPWGPKHAGHIL